MSLKNHLTESLKLNPAPSPWPRMILCCLSVTLPLVAGLYLNQLAASIYGALLGFILILNDHFGPLKQRVFHLCTSFFFIALTFVTGLAISEHQWLLFPVLFLMGFILGKSKGHGLELERLLLFCTFQLLNAALTPGLKHHALNLIFYASLSFGNYICCLFLIYFTLRHKPNFQKSKREELAMAMKKKETQRYALMLALFSCMGLLIAKFVDLSRANWMVGTILIVMMPDKVQSFQKSFQRIFGTLIGVILAVAATSFGTNPFILISFSAVAAFLAPLGLIRNYWLGNTFIAALIMFFLQFGSHHSGYELGVLRLVDITIGCVIGAMGTLCAFPHRLSKN